MLKFFRRIRQSLFIDGGAKRYFFYAIGEIILVVIGILIALQINNWNAGRKDNRLEAAYLENIQRDLTNQLHSIAVQAEWETNFWMAAQNAIQYFDKPGALTGDSLFYNDISLLFFRKTFVITDPTYTDLISSGNIKLLRNKTLKDDILTYYQELRRTEKVIQDNNSFLVDNLSNSTFLKLSYFHFGEFSNFNIDTSGLTKIKPNPYSEVFQEYANNLLLKEENKLALMNAINSRKIVAMNHSSLLKNLKLSTESLLKELL